MIHHYDFARSMHVLFDGHDRRRVLTDEALRAAAFPDAVSLDELTKSAEELGKAFHILSKHLAQVFETILAKEAHESARARARNFRSQQALRAIADPERHLIPQPDYEFQKMIDAMPPMELVVNLFTMGLPDP